MGTTSAISKETLLAIRAAGFEVAVNQAGPLLEQMARDGRVAIYSRTGSRSFTVEWSGAKRLNLSIGNGSSIFEAAVGAIAEDLP